MLRRNLNKKLKRKSRRWGPRNPAFKLYACTRRPGHVRDWVVSTIPRQKKCSMRRLFYTVFQCHVETPIQTKRGNRVGGPEKSNIDVLRRNKTPSVARDWLVSTIPRQLKDFIRKLLHTVFQCHVGTPIQTQNGNRFGGNRAIQDTRFTPEKDAKRRPGLACKRHPSSTNSSMR